MILEITGEVDLQILTVDTGLICSRWISKLSDTVDKLETGFILPGGQADTRLVGVVLHHK